MNRFKAFLFPSKQRPSSQQHEAKSTQDQSPPIMKQSQPNMLWFTDENGVKYQRFIPKGSVRRAVQYRKAEDWNALKKFPLITGGPEQRYEHTDTLRDFDVDAYMALESEEERKRFYEAWLREPI